MLTPYHNKLFSGVNKGAATIVGSAYSDGIYTSKNNGVSWTKIASPSIDPMRVAWGNGLFVVLSSVPSDTDVIISTDGINWTTEAAYASTSGYQWSSITYGNGLFVAKSIGSGGNVSTRGMTSPDGVTWTLRTLPSAAWRQVRSDGTTFVSTHCVSATANNVYTSSDGTSWTVRGLPATGNWDTVGYGDGTWVVAETGNTAYSLDGGTSWIGTASPSDAYNPVVIEYSPELGLFLMTTQTGSGYYDTSPDGINWTQRTMPLSEAFEQVTWTGTAFVTVSKTSGRSFYSNDGINWTEGGTLPTYTSGYLTELTCNYEV